MSMKKSPATAEVEPVAESRLAAAAMDVVTGANGGAANGGSASAEAASGEAARGEAARGEAARGEAARGEAASGEAASGGSVRSTAESGTAGTADVLTLELTDLLSDSNGEIVLFNDSHLPALALRVDAPPVESGELGSHITAAGDDVSGFRYLAFTDGTKLIFQDSVDLVLLGGNGDLHV